VEERMSWAAFSRGKVFLDSVLTTIPRPFDEKSFKGLALKSGFTNSRGREKAN
jgi:hypothetical protein